MQELKSDPSKKGEQEKILGPPIPKEQDQIILNRFKGAMIGAFIGDAAGATIQTRTKLTWPEVKTALEFPGGGIQKVGPGQITDDGELTICLARGLIKGKGVLNLNLIATDYSAWFTSDPFDVGNTLRCSLPKAVKMNQHQAHLLRKGALSTKSALTSQSNGSLMKISSLCLWCYQLSEEEIQQAVFEVTNLTHPNEIVFFANCFYALAFTHLIKFPEDRQGAIERASKWAQKKANQEFLNQGLNELVFNKETIESFSQNVPMGWCLIALSLTFKALAAEKEPDYSYILGLVLQLGGDTDTNACIVGAVIGAITGYQKMPNNYINAVLSWDPSQGGYNRPKWLTPKHVFEKLAEDLMNVAPDTLKMIGTKKEYEKYY